MLVYGVIVYAYVFVLQQSITYAAQEAAEAAVAIEPSLGLAPQQAAVRATAVSALSWLPAGQRSRVLGSSGEKVSVVLCPQGNEGCPSDSDALRVTLTFDVTLPTPLFPVLNLYIVGSVPPLPTTLTATAVVRI